MVYGTIYLVSVQSPVRWRYKLDEQDAVMGDAVRSFLIENCIALLKHISSLDTKSFHLSYVDWQVNQI